MVDNALSLRGIGLRLVCTSEQVELFHLPVEDSFAVFRQNSRIGKVQCRVPVASSAESYRCALCNQGLQFFCRTSSWWLSGTLQLPSSCQVCLGLAALMLSSLHATSSVYCTYNRRPQVSKNTTQRRYYGLCWIYRRQSPHCLT
jgi:hypothetical protein